MCTKLTTPLLTSMVLEWDALMVRLQIDVGKLTIMNGPPMDMCQAVLVTAHVIQEVVGTVMHVQRHVTVPEVSSTVICALIKLNAFHARTIPYVVYVYLVLCQKTPDAMLDSEIVPLVAQVQLVRTQIAPLVCQLFGGKFSMIPIRTAQTTAQHSLQVLSHFAYIQITRT